MDGIAVDVCQPCWTLQVPVLNLLGWKEVRGSCNGLCLIRGENLGET